MKDKFYLNRFIYILLVFQLFIYLCWSFVEMSFLEPLITTFETNESRLTYLCTIFMVLFCGLPYYLPIKYKSK